MSYPKDDHGERQEAPNATWRKVDAELAAPESGALPTRETFVAAVRKFRQNDRVSQAIARISAEHCIEMAFIWLGHIERAALASGREREAVPGCVTRVELIDHRESTGGARAFVAYGCKVALQYQDDGRTLKVFVDDRTPTPAGLPHGSTEKGE